jgi:hypothetical protein
MVEQRVIQHLHFVEVEALRRLCHANRNGIADEMNVMPAGGQFQAQFRGHDSTSAIGGVTGYADFHEPSLVGSGIPAWAFP